MHELIIAFSLFLNIIFITLIFYENKKYKEVMKFYEKIFVDEYKNMIKKKMEVN